MNTENTAEIHPLDESLANEDNLTLLPFDKLTLWETIYMKDFGGFTYLQRKITEKRNSVHKINQLFGWAYIIFTLATLILFFISVKKWSGTSSMLSTAGFYFISALVCLSIIIFFLPWVEEFKIKKIKREITTHEKLYKQKISELTRYLAPITVLNWKEEKIKRHLIVDNDTQIQDLIDRERASLSRKAEKLKYERLNLEKFDAKHIHYSCEVVMEQERKCELIEKIARELGFKTPSQDFLSYTVSKTMEDQTPH